MLRDLRNRLTYANVMSSIAVFMAMGGVAWAASLPRNSVGTPQLKNNAVTSPKIKNKSVTGGDAKANTFTGSQINESKLGQVPSAANADNAANALTAGTAGNASQLAGAGPEAYNIGRAYAYVKKEGGIEPGRSRNVVSADKPATGAYCITLAAGIDVGSVAPITSLDKHFSALTVPPSSPGDDFGILEFDSVNETCPAGQLEFDSFSINFGGGGAHEVNTRHDQAFMFLIP